MKLRSYVHSHCNRCRGHRYHRGYIGFNLPLFEVDETWHEMKERVIASRYIERHSDACQGCTSVGIGYTMVLAILLYKLGLLEKLEIE